MNDIKPGLRRFHGADYTPIDMLAAGRLAVGPDGELVRKWIQTITTTTDELQFTIKNHFHPYAGELTSALLRGSVAGLQAADTRFRDGIELGARRLAPQDYAFYEASFGARYQPGPVVNQRLPVRNLDFDVDGAYSVYNWELFYHIPMAIALQLSRNQRYEEAQNWLHYLFDPTDASDGPPERFWKVQPFQVNEVRQVEDILVALAGNAPETAELRAKTILAIEAWRRAPLRPHLVARTRTGAYKLRTLMAYLDNLLAWGDSLFRKDSPETIDEAAMHYIRAAQLLGKRPQPAPPRGTARAESYRTLSKGLDEFGNALRMLEAELAFDFAPPPGVAVEARGLAAIESIGQSLYFCVPGNDKLLGYWDTVGDRLFKIRNSLNFQGVYRQLPLFDPPIDPAVLARGIAAGLGVDDALANVGAFSSPVRFVWWIRHAQDMCHEVRALGAALLQAMEKEDAEALSNLRSQHENALLTAIESVRYGQLAEAGKNREGVEKSISAAARRYSHFEQLLGRKPDEISLPELEELHAEGLDRFKFRNTEPDVNARAVDYDVVEGMAGLAGGRIVNRHEVAEILLSRASGESMAAASVADATAALFSAMPDFAINCMFWGVGPTIEFGPRQVASAVQALAASMRANATTLGSGSQDAARLNGFARREQEWAQQSNMVAGEITMLYKHLRAAQIREAVAAREWENHKQQMKNARAIEQFLTDEREGKATQQALYTWMKRETQGLYARALDMALEAARMAERAMQHELGLTDSFLQPGYAPGHHGLLAGERLALDLQRMSGAYHELNVRDLELHENVSLLQLNPQGLLYLRAAGTCTLDIPETFFDRRTPGHYLRRLKTVALSIPCVAGPYMLIHCTLTLTGSKIRGSKALEGEKYTHAGLHIVPQTGDTAQIVTSGAQNDDGLFDGAGNDERYLPFEGHGAVSTWLIELPAMMRDFDYSTISDVILHLGYTARAGVDKSAVQASVTESLRKEADHGRTRLFSLREDFPDAWERLRSAVPGDAYHLLELPLVPEHYPYWVQSTATDQLAVQQIGFYTLSREDAPPLRVGSDANPVDFNFVRVSDTSLHECTLSPEESRKILANAFGILRCRIQPGQLDDVCVAISWQAP